MGIVVGGVADIIKQIRLMFSIDKFSEMEAALVDDAGDAVEGVKLFFSHFQIRIDWLISEVVHAFSLIIMHRIRLQLPLTIAINIDFALFKI